MRSGLQKIAFGVRVGVLGAMRQKLLLSAISKTFSVDAPPLAYSDHSSEQREAMLQITSSQLESIRQFLYLKQ